MSKPDRMRMLGDWAEVYLKEYSFLKACGIDDGTLAGFKAKFLREMSSRPDINCALTRIFGDLVKFQYSFNYPVRNYYFIRNRSNNCSSRVKVKGTTIFNIFNMSNLTDKEEKGVNPGEDAARIDLANTFRRYPVLAITMDDGVLRATFLK